MSCIFEIIVVAVLCFNAITTTFATRSYQSDEVFGSTSVVHITNLLPKNSEAMKVHCKSRNGKDFGQRSLGSGDEYLFSAGSEEGDKDSYYCSAFWGRYFTSWTVLELDDNKPSFEVYWKVQDDGFYLRDGTKWLLKATWETE